MIQESRGSIGPVYAVIYFCVDGKRVGFIPIFLLKRLIDPDRLSSIQRADWFHFTDTSTILNEETQERFLRYLKETFLWETIRNLVQTCESERVLLSWPWQKEIPCESIGYQFDVLPTPPRLYRYCRYDKDRIEQLFTGNLLYFTNPGRFNDPFDCNFNEDVRLNLDQAGICCLAARKDSVLMFSQYAQRHTGLCLIFDTALLGNMQIESGDAVRGAIRMVFYFKELPNLKIEDDPVLIATVKSKVWAYEKEFRLFCVNERDRLAGPGLYKVSRAAITGVIFGCEMPLEHMREVRMLTRDREKFSYVRAIRKPDRFGLDFREITYLI